MYILDHTLVRPRYHSNSQLNLLNMAFILSVPLAIYSIPVVWFTAIHPAYMKVRIYAFSDMAIFAPRATKITIHADTTHPKYHRI